MGEFIHRNGAEYRVWSTVTDSYVTTAGNREEMAEYLLEEAIAEAKKDIVERLARADANGTSGMFGKRDATKWDVERCDVCGWLHDPPACEVKEPK